MYVLIFYDEVLATCTGCMYIVVANERTDSLFEFDI
jgi:hypothetical protein